MIHADIRMGIIYGGKGLEFARILSQTILQYHANGYQISPVLIDDNWKSGAGTIDDRIFNDLGRCEFYFVILTKDLEYEPGKFVSRPNVMLELGMALKNVQRQNILCLSPFPNYDFGKSYLFASDLSSQMIAEFDADHCNEDFQRIIDNVILQANIIPVTKQRRGPDLIQYKQYRTNYYNLFNQRELDELNTMSFSMQLHTILDTWRNEKELLPDLETKILYVFERIVFVSFFYKEHLNDGLSDLISFNELFNTDDNISDVALSALKVLEHIQNYIFYRNDPRYKEIIFEKNKATSKGLRKELDYLMNTGCNPLIQIITLNYLGLTYLHMAQAIKTNPQLRDMERECILYGENAATCFSNALCIIQDTVEQSGLLESYVFFNRARTYSLLKKYNEAFFDFTEAHHYRYQLSQTDKLPQYFCTNFFVKSYLSEIEKLRLMKHFSKISDDEYITRLKNLRKDIDDSQLSSGIENLEIFGQFYQKINNAML